MARKFKERERLLENMPKEMLGSVEKLSDDFKKKFDLRLKQGHYACSPRKLLKNTFLTFYQHQTMEGLTFDDFCLIMNVSPDDYSDEFPKDAYEGKPEPMKVIKWDKKTRSWETLL